MTDKKRAVIYARYSSENQRDASIDDQIRNCTAFIERQGWWLGGTYADKAISGASFLRPGYQQVLHDASRGAFDVVVAEALDRISRDQADTATFYKHLSFHGIELVTLSEGRIDELHVGLKGTMNALFLKDLAIKTRRGLEGRVREGRSGGGISYGYALVAGDVGARRIHEAEAEVTRRIFSDYAGGRGPRGIARALNAEGIPGPHGREWRDTAIRGHVLRGTGILNNELYVGRLVWNRLAYVKDPSTGRRRSRMNAEAQVVTMEVPDLRIVDDRLWLAVKARQSGIRNSEGITRARETRFWEKRRAKHILTGLVYCGYCGGRFAAVGRDYLACSAARGRGTCSNRSSIRRAQLEELVLDGLKQRLLAPELVEEFIAAVNEEINRQRRDETAGRASKEQELVRVGRRIATLLDAISEGLRGVDLQNRLDELAQRRDALVLELAAPKPSKIRLHPNLGEVYRRKVEELHAALRDPLIHDEALEIVRGLMERLIIHPAEGGGFQVELIGDIARMVELGAGTERKKAALDERTACSVKVVAGTGFEPVTFRL